MGIGTGRDDACEIGLKAHFELTEDKMERLLNEYIGKSMAFDINGESKETTYFTRIDPISGSTSKISTERLKRPVAVEVKLDIKLVRKCEFCRYQEFTPRKRIEHAGGAISVPNKFPWEKYDWITIYPPFGHHKLLLSDLYFGDLDAMVESSYDLAVMCSNDPEVISFMDFTNWGIFAGASQQHPHSQRKSITFKLDTKQEKELAYCYELFKSHGRNAFQWLAEEEREIGSRVIYDDDVFIAAAFAPSCPDEVIMFPKEDISNILMTDYHQRRKMMRPALGIFQALFFYRGVTDLNISVHMAPFAAIEEARKYYSWHMHIYPRRSWLPVDKAGAEIGFETSVIDTLPENTAEMLRKWYQEGPQENQIAKGKDGLPLPKLVEEFRKLISGQTSCPLDTV